jgi:hypothetical protein
MNSFHLKALQYIQNTTGNATLANFHEDHEPVGPAIWGELSTQGLAYIDSIGIIRLTHDGEAALKSAPGSATSRSRTAARSSSTDNSLDLTNPLNPLSPFSPLSPLSPLSPTFDSAPQPSSDHCSSHSNSTDFGSSSSSSDSSCSYSSDSGSSSSSYD